MKTKINTTTFDTTINSTIKTKINATSNTTMNVWRPTWRNPGELPDGAPKTDVFFCFFFLFFLLFSLLSRHSHGRNRFSNSPVGLPGWLQKWPAWHWGTQLSSAGPSRPPRALTPPLRLPKTCTGSCQLVFSVRLPSVTSLASNIFVRGQKIRPSRAMTCCKTLTSATKEAMVGNSEYLQ